MVGTVQGIDEFEEFAEDIDDIAERLDEVVDRAIRLTTSDYIDRVIENIERSSTSKGGTLDSRSSPYEPGTINDSSDDSQHISDKDSWITLRPSRDEAVIMPHPDMKDRAYWMERGTPDHGPQGDEPMFFYVNGVKIIVAEERDRSRRAVALASRSDETPLSRASAPGEVDGVDPNNFFVEAAMYIQANQNFSKHLEQQLDIIVAEELDNARTVSL